MPPRYLRKPASTHLKKCKEFRIEPCDTVKADGCCGAAPCRLCLELETYADGISYGSAEFGTASWTGTVGGIAFTAYWERGYESGECEFVVIFNGEEVYRSDCYGGASCRDPSGSVATEINYEAGTLRWSVHEPRELQLIDDPDTGCRTHFCGSCHCSCECLCVTIVEYGGDVLTGEICDVAYPCDAPTWAGSIGYFDLSLTLGRDEYGECIVTPTVNGVELDAVVAAGCGSMSASFTTTEGDVITVRCKECTCSVDNTNCCPDLATWPSSLTIEISDPSPEGCYNLTGTLTELDSVSHSYSGELSGTCTWCSQTFDIRFTVILTCNAENGWLIDFGTGSPADDCGRVPPDTYLTQESCDPLLISGDLYCFECALMTCEIPDPPNPPMPFPHDPFCLSVLVYESP